MKREQERRRAQRKRQKASDMTMSGSLQRSDPEFAVHHFFMLSLNVQTMHFSSWCHPL
jgi:hypothetical protein